MLQPYVNKIAALFILISILLISSSGCDGQSRHDRNSPTDKKMSPCEDIMKLSETSKSMFPSFGFLNGSWTWSSTLRCKQGGTLYTDSLLRVAEDSYLCVNIPMVRFSTMNSFGVDVYEHGRLDSLRWREKIPKGHDRRLKTTGLECGFYLDRDSVESFTIQMPNAEYVFEYINDDTIGFFYDSYFFVLAKKK